MSSNSRQTSYGKGDNRRSFVGKEMDMGSFGCKKGWHVYRGGKKCVYCGRKNGSGNSVDKGQ